MISASRAPKTAARIMNGIVATARFPRFLRYVFKVEPVGRSHPSGAGTGQASLWAGGVRRTSRGTDTSNNSGTARRTSATGSGNRANVIISTTTLSVGELITVASTVLGLAPPTNSPRPMGATQLAQTPRGTPATAPRRVLPAALLKRTSGRVDSNVNRAAPKPRPKVMPMRLVHIQLIAVRSTRTGKDISGITGMSASKLNAPLTLMDCPL